MSKTFNELGLKKEVIQALKESEFNNPFPIQEETIPIILKGEDVIGQANTGTGKTAAYALPILNKINANGPLQALVLVPTRELALQVTSEMIMFARYTGSRISSIYGGQNINNQIFRLKKGIQIVVATPGRLIDHLKRKTINLDNVNTVVLDEADLMLDMGFIDDIRYIFSYLNKNKQTCLFSATMLPEIIQISKEYMNTPKHVKMNNDITIESIKQSYLVLNEKDKYSNLVKLLNQYDVNDDQILVFAETKDRSREIVYKLKKDNYNANLINSDLTQKQRNFVMRNFRKGITKILVATDIAARGLDIPAIKFVINYDIPQDPMIYFHRIGRTARAGLSGSAISLVSSYRIRDFEKIVSETKYFIKRLNDEMGIPLPKFNFNNNNNNGSGRRFHNNGGGRRFYNNGGGGRRFHNGAKKSWSDKTKTNRRFSNRKRNYEKGTVQRFN